MRVSGGPQEASFSRLGHQTAAHYRYRNRLPTVMLTAGSLSVQSYLRREHCQVYRVAVVVDFSPDRRAQSPPPVRAIVSSWRAPSPAVPRSALSPPKHRTQGSALPSPLVDLCSVTPPS